MATVYFYGKPTARVKQENVYLGNFYPAPVTIEGITYPTVEHYFQCQKFEESWKFSKVIECKTPKEAQRTAKQLGYDREEWQHRKEQVMATGIRAKFSQHSELRQALLSTAPATLVEDSHKDYYWGGSLAGSKNRMGILLMQLRDQLE